jgi:hypothetical protein
LCTCWCDDKPMDGPNPDHTPTGAQSQDNRPTGTPNPDNKQKMNYGSDGREPQSIALWTSRLTITPLMW